jgi:hypothetical protein
VMYCGQEVCVFPRATGNSKLDTQNLKLETRNSKLETCNRSPR